MGEVSVAQPSPGAIAADAEVVRVSIVADSRRADLTLPSTVPVAQLLPQIASLLPAGSARPRELTTVTGERLRPDSTLAGQDVHDGHLLWLVDPIAIDPPEVYDDPVRLVAQVSEARPRWPDSWVPGLQRGIASACALTGAGALAEVGTRPAAVLAATLGGIAVTLASTLSWGGRSIGSALAGLVAMGYGAAAGAVMAPPMEGFEQAAAGALLAGTAVLVWSASRDVWLRSLVLAVGLVAAAGLAGAHRGSAISVLVGLSVYVGEALPALVVTHFRSTHDPVDAGGPDAVPDVAQREVQLAWTRLRLGTVTCGLVLLLSAPVLIRGPGVGLVLVCGLATTARAVRTSDRLLVGTDLAVGVGAVAVAAAGIMLFQPQWAPGLACLSILGAVAALLAGTGRGGRGAVSGMRGAALVVVGPMTALCGVLAWPGR